MKNEKELSEKQEAILDFIKKEYIVRGFSPSVREICEAVGLKSTSSVHAHLKTLEKKGYIKRDPEKSRAIVPIGEEFQNGSEIFDKEIVNIPVVGEVAAGQPIFADQNISGYFPMPAEDMPSGNLFMLRVKGESMINAGIYSGDYIIVKQQNTAENGEIVVAMVDDSATVKTFYKEDGYIRLQPENDEMDPILLEDVQIVGKLAGLYRVYR